MPSGHSHQNHHHIDPDAGDFKVAAAIAVNLLLTIAQIIGGILSGSVALIADAIHNLSDAVSLVIAFAARRIARRPSDGAMTFGYSRIEIVAALVNYTTLILISFYLLYEGIVRLIDPPGVEGWIVVVVAGVALIVDAVTAFLTYRLSKASMNMRAAFLHNVADAMTSIAVMVAGTLILLYDWRLVDPIVTIGIALYILWHSFAEVRPVIHILMLGRPPEADVEELRARMTSVIGVQNVHHLHFWQLSEHKSSVEAHVVIDEHRRHDSHEILNEIKQILRQEFGVQHSTLEIEMPGEGCAGDDNR